MAAALIATLLPMTSDFLGKPIFGTPAAVLCGFERNNRIRTALGIDVGGHIGKEFSIITADASISPARGLYLLVRHPLYLGELVVVSGIVAGVFNYQRMLMLAALALCQVYRILEEERLLSEAFPEYNEYSSRTARLIPGIF